MIVGNTMNVKLFNLLLQLKAVKTLLEYDGNGMGLSYGNPEKLKQIQEEVGELSQKETELLNELRHEILSKEEPNSEKKPKITKKDAVIRKNGRKKG